jgi:myo-inositol-1(or 4)-monophosphatase
MLETIKKIIKQAGKIAIADYNASDKIIHHKGAIDIVTQTDLKIEDFLKSKILKNYPDHDLLMEETDNELKKSNHLWIIDPLDGTTNFAHKFPFFAISIAYEENQIMQLAAVYIPFLQELFWAEKDKGAYLNGRKIQVSETAEINQSLVATGFPYDRWQKGDHYLQEFAAFMKRTQGVRRAGAAAIDLCYTACGRLDGFFERKLKPWDTAAGSLIIREAGGKVTNYSGDLQHYTEDTIIASNGIIHQNMLDILSQVNQGDNN